MVRANLREIDQPGTGKRQTRRVMRHQPYLVDDVWWVYDVYSGSCHLDDVVNNRLGCMKYQVGDFLYVREAWRTHTHLDCFAPRDLPVDTPIFFEADAGGDQNSATGKFRQGMFMPRWASRLTLHVTDVRVQRLQDISEEDAIAEGIERLPDIAGMPAWLNYPDGSPAGGWLDPRESFRTLWNSINEKRGFGWGANPFVVAVTFQPHLVNIDDYLKRIAM